QGSEDEHAADAHAGTGAPHADPPAVLDVLARAPGRPAHERTIAPPRDRGRGVDTGNAAADIRSTVSRQDAGRLIGRRTMRPLARRRVRPAVTRYVIIGAVVLVGIGRLASRPSSLLDVVRDPLVTLAMLALLSGGILALGNALSGDRFGRTVWG